MKCFVCNEDKTLAVAGPKGLSICNDCVDTLKNWEGVDVEGTCSWCGKEVSKRNPAAGASPDGRILICNDCLKLAGDILETGV